MNWPLVFRAYLFLGLIEAAGAMAAFSQLSDRAKLPSALHRSGGVSASVSLIHSPLGDPRWN
jgi:hypothetical protein